MMERLHRDPDPTFPHMLGRTKRGEQRCQTGHPSDVLQASLAATPV